MIFALGKSYAILADAARDLGHPQFRGLILRKTLDELRELIQKSQELYKRIFPGIKWNKQSSTWTTLSGGTLWFSYLERDEDVTRYQGQAFNYIAFDELTHWATPYAWEYLRSRNRTTSKDLIPYMRASSNPGGPGHNWVKKMFVDPAKWGEAFWATDIDTGEVLKWPDIDHATGQPHPKAGQPLFKRRFIPSKLSDNPYLYNDGVYEASLLSLREDERKRLLEGNWDVISGAAFTEWDRKIHVVEPFHIPREWTRFRACDYGYGGYCAVLWFAISPQGQLIVYDELYVSKVLATDVGDIVAEKEELQKVSYGVLDSSCWANRGDTGPSIAEQMTKRYVKWRPSDRSRGSRVAGKNELHRRLAVDEYTGEPGIVFFDNCVNTIAQLPVIPLDKNNPEDVDTKSEDHIYDALRYGIMTRPLFRDQNLNPKKVYQPADATFGY